MHFAKSGLICGCSQGIQKTLLLLDEASTVPEGFDECYLVWKLRGQSAILGFGLFKMLDKHAAFQKLTVGENVIIQTTAVATATMPLAAGIPRPVVCQWTRLTPPVGFTCCSPRHSVNDL